MATYYVNSVTAQMWLATHVYSLGARATSNNQGGQSGYWPLVFECTTAGTSGASMPAWNLTIGGTTTDGTVTWTTRSPTTWANATSHIFFIASSCAAGDTIYVSNNHNETSAGTSWTQIGTNTTPIYIYCANDAATPPTSLATTGVISYTTGNITLATNIIFYGLTFNNGSGSTASLIVLLTNAGNTTGYSEFINCKFVNISTNVGTYFLLGSQADSRWYPRLELTNCTFTFAAIGQSIYFSGSDILWKNTASAIVGSIPTTLFTAYTPVKTSIILDGIDLSNVNTTLISGASTNVALNMNFYNCALNGSVTKVSGSSIGFEGTNLSFQGCSSSTAPYSLYNWDYTGTSTQETTIVKSGGASDGTTPISWKIISNTVSKYYKPVMSTEIAEWNDVSGSAKTATIEFVHDSLTALTNADIYMEVEYLSSLTTPQTSIVTTRNTDLLATGSAYSVSAVTWITTGLTNPNKQYMQISFTPQQKGPIRVKVYLIKPSYTVYVDPKVTIV